MQSLEQIRKKIDDIDAGLVELLAARFALTDQVGRLKANQNLSAQDTEREVEQMNRIGELALKHGLEPSIAQTQLRSIIDRVIERHTQIDHSK